MLKDEYLDELTDLMMGFFQAVKQVPGRTTTELMQ